jgi:UDP-N-acetylglucosamine--N-acetylmuramyl-(pentapeptide) pyrophosphoryl-undecaprenol N-acetylglucosamine transferase
MTGPLNLLVFGGSQGARFFSDAVPPALAGLDPAHKHRLFVTQQAREEDVGRVSDTYTAAGIRAQVAPFFSNLPEEMAKAHVVIGRAGASTIAELTVIGRPAILVPLPHAVDNDQLLNARRLETAEAGWCMEQKTATPETLRGAVLQLIATPELLTRVAANAKRLGRPDAVIRLADLVLSL